MQLLPLRFWIKSCLIWCRKLKSRKRPRSVISWVNSIVRLLFLVHDVSSTSSDIRVSEMFQNIKVLGMYLVLRVLHGELQNGDDRVKSIESQVAILDNFLRVCEVTSIQLIDDRSYAECFDTVMFVSSCSASSHSDSHVAMSRISSTSIVKSNSS